MKTKLLFFILLVSGLFFPDSTNAEGHSFVSYEQNYHEKISKDTKEILRSKLLEERNYFKKISFNNPNIKSNCLKDKNTRICIEETTKYQSQLNNYKMSYGSPFYKFSYCKKSKYDEFILCWSDVFKHYDFVSCKNGGFYNHKAFSHKEIIYLRRNFCNLNFNVLQLSEYKKNSF